MQNKNKGSLIIWIVALIAIGSLIGYLMKPKISSWYSTLNRPSITPPNESKEIKDIGMHMKC